MLFRVPFELRVIMAVECARCPVPDPPAQPERVTLVDVRCRPDDLLPVPELPRGWRLVDREPICDKHDVQITDRTDTPKEVTA